MTQLAQGLGFDLPDTFAGHFEILTDFFESMVGGFADAEPLPQNFLFPWRECFQCAVDLALEIVSDRRLQRSNCLLVLNKVAQMAVFFLADSGVPPNRFPRNLQDLSHVV